MSSDKIANLTATSFDLTVLESDVPVLVDFWADWCAPCKAAMPRIERIADKYGDGVRVVKLNIDDHQAIAVRFNVMSIPTFMLFVDGEVRTSGLGVASLDDIEEEIENIIG